MSRDERRGEPSGSARGLGLFGGVGAQAAAALTLYTLAYGVWFLFLTGSAADRRFGSVFAQVPAGLLAALLAGLAATPPRLDVRTRHAWRLLAIAFATYALGDLVWLFSYLGLHEDQAKLGSRFCYFSHYLLLFVGLLSFQRFPKSRLERLTFALDAATIFLGGLMVLWYFAIGPLAASGTSDPNTVVAQIAFALADLQVLFGIAVNGVGRGEERYRPAFLMLLCGLVALLGGDVMYAQHRLAGTSGDGGAADLVFMLRWLLVGLGAFVHLRSSRRGVAREAEEGPRAGRLEWLPFASVAAGYLTLGASVFGRRSPAESGLVLAAIGLTGVVLARQITALRENIRLGAESATRRSEARFRSLVQNASDLIAVVDDLGAIRYQSPSAQRVLGYGPEALLGTPITSLVPAEEAPRVLAALAEAFRQPGASPPAEWRLLRGDGRVTRAEVVATNLRDDPNIRGVVLTIRDIEERKHFEEQLRHQALHDLLTGLANRALLFDRARHAQARARRDGSACALLLLDVDDFKAINDRLGHAAGDEVLAEVARRLAGCLRSDDTPGRLGGDEFAVLLEDTADEKAAREVADRIAAALRVPMSVAGTAVQVSASIGIVVSGRVEAEGELFRNADVAMYQAKKRGKGQCEVYDPGMHAAVLERLEMEADLRRAVEKGEIVVHFQPIVDLETGDWVGAEALARWDHPRRGLIAPSGFISLAEDTGLIVGVGGHVLMEACRLAGHWANGGGSRRHVSVNLSARQLLEAGIVDQVAAALRRGGLRPDQLVLEITESVLMVEQRATVEELKKALGVRVALDDFGTGYSSLAYLQDLPVDILKLDQAFLRGFGSDGDLPPIARGVIDLGRTLHLEIVAEGIERAEEARALRRVGCRYGQGYHFGRPLEPHDFRRRLSELRMMA